VEITGLNCVAETFWREIDREAADLDVTVALELPPQNLVFNPAGIRELVERTGATHIGVELDASHLFWQWMDPVAVVQDLGPLVVHAAAKDVTITRLPRSAASSTTGSGACLRTSRARTSAATSGPTSGRRTRLVGPGSPEPDRLGDLPGSASRRPGRPSYGTTRR
jgi:sugar phosphate isomerase/epimerase